MDVEGLLKQGHINYDEYETYILFCNSNMGHSWLQKRTMETFMEQPSPENCIGEAFAFTDGRRSLLRCIHGALNKIQSLLKEVNDDSGNGNG